MSTEPVTGGPPERRPPPAASSLARVVGLWGAVWMGLGSILGTGVFVSLGVATEVAGAGVVFAVTLAAGVAIVNGLSSAQLAAAHPVSGGTYEYGYRFVLALTALVAGGVRRSNRTNLVIVTLTLTALLAFVGFGAASVDAAQLSARLGPATWAAALASPGALLEATAVAAVGAVIAALVLVGDLKTTWSFSAFTVLLYYGLTHVAALSMPAEARRFPAWIAGVGLVSCFGLAFFVDMGVWVAGLGLLGLGFAVRAGVRQLE